MVKKYLIWCPKVVTQRNFEHPNDGNKINARWKWFIQMFETWYWNTLTDWRMLWYIEYDENIIDDIALNEFIMQYKADYAFFLTDEVYANELLLKWYWLNKDWEQNVSVENFNFIEKYA